jgi:molybdate transport system ATP-binding protein
VGIVDTLQEMVDLKNLAERKPADVFIEKKLSGKYKFEGEILEMQQDDVVHILTLAIGNNVAKIIATDDEVPGLRIGDKVVISSKAFNPILMPVR